MRTAAAILVLASSLQAADWISLKSGNIEIISDAGQKAAGQTLDRLLQIQRLLQERRDPEPVALKVFLFASARDYRATAPEPNTSGFYQSGFEGDSIATYVGAPALPRVVMHEYAHFAMHRKVPRPDWLEEGLAEYSSNASFGKASVRVGDPIPEHLARLARGTWLTPEQMQEPRQDLLFYAQSWAVVHMLVQTKVGNIEKVSPQMLPQLLAELHDYIPRIQAVTIKLPPLINSSAIIERISPLNALLMRAELALETQHPDLARTLYAEASRKYPDAPELASALLFQKALLEGDQAALEKAAELNPKLGEAQLLLGERATDRGDLDAAIRHLERAADLMLRKSNAWYALGFAQQKRGDVEAARAALDQALRTATTMEQTTMARTLLESLR
jgi:hypothetical protein